MNGAELAAAARAPGGERVTERHQTPGHSDEQSAKKSARSVMDQAMRRERSERAWPSSGTLTTRKAGLRCEHSGMEEHRTKGGADGMK